MANKQQQVADAEEKIEVAIDKTESFIEKNFKSLIIAVAAILVICGGYFGISQMSGSKNETASSAMYQAEQYFAIDSFSMALNGCEDFEGFLSIIDQYGSTEVGNIAQHYAGICYFKLNDLENATSYLSNYKAVKGLAATTINAQNIGLRGDILLVQGNKEGAIALYSEAAKIENDFTAPTYLKKAGMVYASLGDKENALKAYESIKNQYPNSIEARDVDKLIGTIQ